MVHKLLEGVQGSRKDFLSSHDDAVYVKHDAKVGFRLGRAQASGRGRDGHPGLVGKEVEGSLGREGGAASHLSVP